MTVSRVSLRGWTFLALLACLLFGAQCCKQSTEEPPESAGVSNAYGTNGNDEIQQLLPHHSDGVLCVGFSQGSGSGDYSLYVLRVDDNGYTPWGATSALPGELSGRLNSFGLQTAPDGSIWTGLATQNGLGFGEINSGNGTLPELRVLKISDGLDAWDPRITGGGMVPTRDNSFTLVGSVADSSQATFLDDALAIQTDRNGGIVWANAFDTGGRYEYLTDAVATDDGGLVAAGFATNATGTTDLILIGLSGTGDVRFARRISSNYGFSEPSIKRSATGYVLCGVATLNIGPRQLGFLIETDQQGHVVQSNLLEADGRMTPRHLQPIGDGWGITGNYEAASLDRGTDAFWVRTDAAFAPNAAFTLGAEGIETANAQAPTERGGFWLGGGTESFDSSSDLLLIRVNDRLESRCHQQGLDVRTQGLSLTESEAELNVRNLTYWESGIRGLTTNTNIKNNRSPESQPCSN